MNREELKQIINENITNQIRDDSITPYGLGGVLNLLTDNLALKDEVPNPGPTPVQDVKPDKFGITILDGYDRIPLATQDRTGWVSNGIAVSDNFSIISGHVLSSCIVRRRNGKILTADATANNEATNLIQVTNLIQNSINNAGFVRSENSGLDNVINGSPQSLLLNVGASRINLTKPDSRNGKNIIINSQNSEINGYGFNNLITASQGAIITDGFCNAAIAAISGTIGANRRNNVIIASTETNIETWNSGSTLKWNCAIIASRGGQIQASNSYTLVTGKLTQSNGSAQLVCGQANVREASRSVDDPLKKAFIVGNGVGNDNPALNVYSNAFYVTQGGRAWVQNELEIDKAGGGVVLKTPDGRRVLLTIGNDLQISITPL